MSTSNRLLAGVAAAACVLLASSLGQAQAFRGDKGGAEYAMVEAIDLRAGTIELDGTTYTVTDRTALSGMQGERITLRDLAPPAPVHGLHDLGATPTVRFRATQVRGKNVLTSAQLVPTVPN